MVLVLLVFGVLSAPKFIAGATSSSLVVPTGTVLTNTTLGGFTQVDEVDMLSAHLGYAIATGALPKGRYNYYLVRTTDLGRTWTVRSEIAANVYRYPIFSDFASNGNDPAIDFVNAQVGYVHLTGGRLELTRDAGVTWGALTVSNSSTSYAVSSSTLSVVSTLCPSSNTGSTSLCKSEFTLYPVGSATPTFSARLATGTKRYEPTVALLAAAPGGTDVINLDTSNFTTPTSLRITHDAGRTWGTFANPCSTLAIEQLIVAPSGQWLLSCFRDEGMSQGPMKILRSADAGKNWRIVVNDTPGQTHVGNLGGTPLALFFSGNEQLIYAAIMNPAGGLIASHDGGSTWSAESYFGYTGGAPGSISNFGPTSSIYQVSQGPMFVTRDSRHWTLIPQLPAGPYRQMSICTRKDLRVSWYQVTSGGLHYTYFDFTNTSAVTCYLNGAPVVQPLDANFAAVGPPQTTELNSPGGNFVTLKAKGGVANVSYLTNLPVSKALLATCAPQQAKVVAIDFAPSSHFDLTLESHHFAVCTTQPSVFVSPVQPGRGKP